MQFPDTPVVEAADETGAITATTTATVTCLLLLGFERLLMHRRKPA